MTALADSAIAYAQNEGLYVFPLRVHGKVPLTSHGLDDATLDALTIETWWSRWPDANIAIRTGDIVVVDEDRPGALAELAAKHSEEIPDTRIARTGKGRHYYFTQPQGVRIRNTAGKLATGIDTRGDGGYVVAPPSVHPDGGVYAWESTATPAPFPGWMSALLTKTTPKVTPFLGRSTPYGQRALEAEVHAVSVSAEGTRNDRLNTAAFSLGQLVAGGELDEHDARASLEAAARACGLSEKESAQTIQSGLGAGLVDPRNAPENGHWPRLEAVPAPQLQQPAPTPRITIEPWQTFSQNSQAELEFLINDLWPAKSFAFIASPPKKGKTWLGLAAALSIATGRRFIAAFDIPEPRKVLYLALEGARPAIRARIGALARGLALDPDSDQLDNLHISYRPRGINLADSEWAAEIANLSAEGEYAVVFVDVLRNAARIKENDSSEFGLLRSLLEPALAHTSIALLHHFTKLSETSKERTPAERMSGSGAMYGALDVGIFITGSENHARRLRLEFDGRDIAMPDPMWVHLSGEGSGPNSSLLYEDEAIWNGEIPEVGPDDLKGSAEAIAHWIRTVRNGEVAMVDAAEHFEITDDTLRKRQGALERLGIAWTHRGARNKVFLVANENSLDVSITPTETTTRTPTYRIGDSVATPHDQAVSPTETESTEHLPTESTDCADLQGLSTTRIYRSPTGIDPPLAESGHHPPSDNDDIDLPF